MLASWQNRYTRSGTALIDSLPLVLSANNTIEKDESPMLSIVGAMLAVIITWALLAIIFVGVGRLLGRLVRIVSRRPASLFIYFWLGWGLAILFLQLWHFQFKIDWRALAIVATTGLIGIIWDFKALRSIFSQLKSIDRKITIRMMLIAGATIFFWSNIAIGPPHNEDTGGYHMPGVRWNNAYPVVPGLGNLHGRMAFNNSSYLYASMLEVGPWTRKSHHLANSLVSLALLLQIAFALPQAMQPKNRRWLYSMFLILLLPAATLYCYKNSTSFQADLSIFLIGIIITSQLLALMTEQRHQVAERHFQIFSICFLAAVGLSVKLSFGVFGFSAAILALGILHLKPHASETRMQRIWLTLIAILLASAIIIPWMARGIMLSGYVAFPSTFAYLDVPWRVPIEWAQSEKDWIYSWARGSTAPPDEVLGNWRWVGGWVLNQFRDILKIVLPITCTVVGVITALRYRHPSSLNTGLRPWLWLFLLPSIITVLFVLNTAPSFAFVGASLWILAAGSLVLALHQFDRSSEIFRKRTRLTWAFTLLVLCVVLIKASRYTNWQPHQGSGFQPTPVVELRQLKTSSGLTLYLPKTGCSAWDAPLPNTPYFHSNLSLQREGDLGSGFMIIDLPDKNKPSSNKSNIATKPANKAI